MMASECPNLTEERNAEIYVAVIDGATFAQLAVRAQKAYARERTNAWEARRQGATSYLGRPIPKDV